MKPLLLLKDLGMQYATENSKNKNRYGLYQCYCGKEFKTKITSIKNGYTKSCGCLRDLKASKLNAKHNLAKHPLYKRYKNMKKRCYNKKDTRYEDYGKRGIKICDEWLSDFMSFYNWAINNGYKKELSIDRINNNGNYEPSNCRWTTREIQSANSRRIRINNTSGYRGVYFRKNRSKWVAEITINSKTKKLGSFKCRLAAAYSYDNYIIENNLEHTRNFN